MSQFRRNAETRKGDGERAFTPKPKANAISVGVCLADLEGPGFCRRLLMFPGKH